MWKNGNFRVAKFRADTFSQRWYELEGVLDPFLNESKLH